MNQQTQTTPQKLQRAEILEQSAQKDQFGSFKSPFVIETITMPGGEKHNLLHFTDPTATDPVVITLPSRATREELLAIQAKIIALPETCQIFTALAEGYALRQPVLIEGGTAIGKTYAVNKFTELLYGSGVKPCDFYCSGHTDVSELLGKWVPRVKREAEQQAWDKFVASPQGEARLQEIAAGVEKLPEDNRKDAHLTAMRTLAREIGLSGDTQWEFKPGVVPQAMCGQYQGKNFTFNEAGGEGVPLHIQEVGLARPAIVNALLSLRGENGHVAESLQLWVDGGRTIHAGPKFFWVMTTNPPEDYLDRNEIDPALARGVVFLSLGDLSKASLDMAAKKIFTYNGKSTGTGQQRATEQEGLDLARHPTIGVEVAEIVTTIHALYVSSLKSGETNRTQRIPATLDDMSRVAETINTFQVIDSGSHQVDMARTVRRAVERIYINRLRDPELKENLKKTLEDTLNGDTGKKTDIDGQIKTRATILARVVSEAYATIESEKPKVQSVAEIAQGVKIEDLSDEVSILAAEAGIRLPGVKLPGTRA